MYATGQLRESSHGQSAPAPIPRSTPNASLMSESGGGYFDLGPGQHGSRNGSPVASGACSSMSIPMPPSQTALDMAFTALQYLPMPLFVLSVNKDILLANEAAGRLFGIDPSIVLHPDDALDAHDLSRVNSAPRTTTDVLYGVPIRSMGIDLLQNGSAIWVTWDDFLDSIVGDAKQSHTDNDLAEQGDTTPRTTGTGDGSGRPQETLEDHRSTVHEVVVDIAFSTHRDPATGLPQAPAPPQDGKRRSTAAPQSKHIEATLIISTWALEGQQYFTLTFTAAHSVKNTQAKSSTRSVTKMHRSYMSGMGSGSSNSSGGRRTHHSSYSGSPGSGSIPWLPNGPASHFLGGSASTLLSKSTKMKDALLNALPMPVYAMWKDESFGVPNKAALKLLGGGSGEDLADTPDQREFLGRYSLYTEDFSKELTLEEYPIMFLMRTKKRFSNMRIGMFNAVTGDRLIFDVDGEEILDENTGEFLGGLVIFRDVTAYARAMRLQEQKTEKTFETLANMIPVIVWTSNPDGTVDYFSDQWYDYTGMTPEQSLGTSWGDSFFRADADAAAARWSRSLATGDEYLTEYRCRSSTGEYRWMLGRALPMRDSNGQIVKWFGTCTDIHELVQTRDQAKQLREQLLTVLDHAKITLWATDRNKRLILHEGRNFTAHDGSVGVKPEIGRDVFDVFSEIRSGGKLGLRTVLERPMNDILSGRSQGDAIETAVFAADNDDKASQRWYRTRFVPLQRQLRDGGIPGQMLTDGVVCLSMDVTELKRREEELRERDRENSRLLAQSEAAKEASKMKSQFLANMSHEIRTPIAGVIGMAELLLDDTDGTLTQDQRECAENLQRSANGLLTVINDILDFSKVESGRLDIEEVQFDLNVVVRDVNKMLSFAAERKGLNFIDETQKLQRLKVIGDPGRLRQILTNLLTNSIKFTSEGHVKMGVQILKEGSDKVVVKFVVEDTGIGIEEEVRKRLFQPFSQADSSTARRFGGTGLGLTISKNLVELMHGDISLDSTLGQGTRATFWIPFARAPFYSEDSPPLDMGPLPDRLQSELAVSEYTTSSKPASPGTAIRRQSSNVRAGAIERAVDLSEEERKRIHVLVVEDNPINQQIALKTIKKLHFSVNAVWNGQEALDYLLKPHSAEHPKPDIILMDVQMPVMDGYRATYTIRHAEPFVADARIQNTPIVAMTASAIQGDREKCESAGMNDYLSKPVNRKILEKMLVKWGLDITKKRKRSMSSVGDAPMLKRLDTAERLAMRSGPSSITSSEPERRSLPSRPVRTSSAFSHSIDGTDANRRSIPSPEALSDRLTTIDSATASALRHAAESPGLRVQNHLANEEMAMQLRDEQLLASAGPDPSVTAATLLLHSNSSTTTATTAMADGDLGPSVPVIGDSDDPSTPDALPEVNHHQQQQQQQHPPLTRENISRLDSVAGRMLRRHTRRDDETTNSSARATAGD